MRRSVKIVNRAVKGRDISEQSLDELQEQLFWAILRCREEARNMCMDAGFTPEEAGLQFIHPTMGARKSYTMICLRMEH
jgi:hypothetical protein